MAPRILLSLVGENDPYLQPESNPPLFGPLLTILSSIRVDEVFLLVSPYTSKEKAEETNKFIVENLPKIKCHELVYMDRSHIRDGYDFDGFATMESAEEETRKILAKTKTQNILISYTCGLNDEISSHIQHLMIKAAPTATTVYVRPPLTSWDRTSFVGMIKPKQRVSEKENIFDKDPDAASLYIPEKYKRLKPIGCLLDRVCDIIGIIGTTPEIRKVNEECARYARSDSPVLITGAEGTGKERTAKLIQMLSSRCDKPFKKYNIAAVTGSLFEAELFGYKKGSFSGAYRDTTGILETAEGGTLFFDEIGDLPLDQQVKILRVLQEKEFKPVGGVKDIKLNVRFIFATNCDIQEKIKANLFRRDLYSRINALPVHLPSLMERQADIPVLAEHFLTQLNNKNKAYKKHFNPKAITALQSHTWTENIRELENIIIRAFNRCDGIVIDESHIMFGSGQENPWCWLPQPHDGFKMKEYIAGIRRNLKERALKITQGNITEAANLLGVTPGALSQTNPKKPK